MTRLFQLLTNGSIFHTSRHLSFWIRNRQITMATMRRGSRWQPWSNESLTDNLHRGLTQLYRLLTRASHATPFSNITHFVIHHLLVPHFSAKSIYDELFFKRFRVSVSNEGVVNWVPGGKFLTSCQLDITYYPFDDQECHIDLVDWAYHGLQVKLVNGSYAIGLDAYTESGEWAIIGTLADSGDQYYESDPGVPFPRVRFTLLLRRKPMFYTINIITPCMTMSLLALLVFYLPPDSGEKVSLGITVLLSFSVFLLLVAENVPKTSEFVPLLGKYFQQ